MRIRASFPLSFLFCCSALVICPQSRAAGGDCTPVPPGVVSWWSGEGNAESRLGTNHGSLIGTIGFAPGRVGQAFVCGASGSAVRFQNAAALQVQNFTIEGWVKRESLVSVGPSGIGFIFGYGAGGYGLALYQGGSLMLTKVGESYVASDTLITDTEFHHVAVTKTGAAVMFYVDGQAYPGPDFQTTFTFSTAPAIGAQGDHLTYQLAGRVDELSIYNRALSQAEVQSIHTAGMLGKCAPSSAPSIVAHPQSRFSFLGQNVSFSTLANGSQPLSYQWLFNGLPLAGEIQPGLMLTNVQPSQAGDYCVVVTNAFGAVTSSIAVLAVGTTRCMSLPEGIISWWSADDNTSDKVGYNNGAVLGDVAYSTGRIGKAFVAGNSASGVRVANDPALRVQDFTIETWAKRENSAAVGPGGIGFLFAYGSGGYGFAAYQDGSLMLTKVGVGYISSGPVLTNLDFHHIAVTKSGSSVTFYVDGIPHPAASYDPGFSFTTTPAIGAQGDNLTYGFYGLIDELSIYNRPLSHDEVKGIYQADSAGKCSPAFPPVVFSHPRSQIALPGAAVAFEVLAGGTRPLGYQWLFNGRTLQGAENPLLVLTNVQPPDLGGYAVVVTNAFGAVTSSVAQLTLHPATAECLPSPAGLAAWWTGEGNAFDNAGTNHGLISGAVDFVPGVAGQAFRFGTDSPAITVHSGTNLALRSFTIEAWISPEDISIARPILEFAAPYQLSPLQFWYSTENVPGRLSGYVRDPAGPALEVTTAPGLIPSNQWSHVAFTYDYTSRTALLYVNGFQAGSNSSSVAIQPNTLLPVNLGVRPFGGLVPLPGRRHLGKMTKSASMT